MNEKDPMPDTDDPRFEATWVQTARHYRFGLWGCMDMETGNYVAFGPKGKMGQLTRILNDSDVSSNL